MKSIQDRFMNSKFAGQLLLVAALLMSPPGISAQLELSVVDDKGNPLKDAVAALVPQQKIDYTAVPTAIMDPRKYAGALPQ
jgi:hypothetical protein